MNRVCRLIQLVGVDEVFNLSPQHVDSEHKPPPPPPPPTRPRITTDTNRVKGDNAKSLPLVEQADEAPDETMSDTNSDQHQVGLANLSSGTPPGRFSHPGVTSGNRSVKSILLPGGRLWARILNQVVPRFTREIFPPEKGDLFFFGMEYCALTSIHPAG